MELLGAYLTVGVVCAMLADLAKRHRLGKGAYWLLLVIIVLAWPAVALICGVLIVRQIKL